MKDIKKIREEKGLSKNQLAKASGLSPSLIGKLETGKIKAPSLYTIECLAKGLYVTAIYLMED